MPMIKMITMIIMITRITMITWKLLKGCPVRRRGAGSMMLLDVQVWNVGLKCHLDKYKTKFGTIKCNSVQLCNICFFRT